MIKQPEIILTTVGMKGGAPKENFTQGKVCIEVYAADPKTAGSITVDVFQGSGETYKRRDSALIEILFDNGKHWKGSFSDLENQLLK